MEDSMAAGTIDSSHKTTGSDRPVSNNYFRSVARYWEQLYEDKHLTARIYQERKDMTLHWIADFAIPAGARILDVGCGAGHTAVSLARRGFDVDALDCEQAMLDMVARRAQEAGVPVKPGLGDAHELPFGDHTFDVVLSLGLIPWLHSPKKALAEMRRVLKPGGFLVISSDNSQRLTYKFDPFFNLTLAPARNVITSFLRKRKWMRMPETTPPMMQPTREFDCWLSEAGFQKLKAATIGFGPFTLFRRQLLPDHTSARLHRRMQKMAYAGWPFLRESGAHYLVAAVNPADAKAKITPEQPARCTTEPFTPESYDVSTPVVVLGANTHGSLGIMRSLGRMGVPVHAVCSPPRGPASYSAFCKSAVVWDFAHAKPEDTISFLLELAQWIGRPSILIPTWDEMAVFVAEHYDTLKTAFIYPPQSAVLARSLCDKKEMAQLARKCGVPTPEVVFPRSVGDVLEYMQTAHFPVMLKGIDGNKLKERTGKKMVIVHTPIELREMYMALEDPNEPNLMLQEYIPGGDDSIWMFNGYFNAKSECLVGFTGRKLRQTPVHTGMTSLGICLRNEVVEETTRKFMSALGYRGILDIGYRYDARDGQYKVLDINPRIGATFRLFVADNGMDVARALYLDLTGQQVPSSALREGRKWFVESDLKSCLDYHREGSLTFRRWLRSLRGIEEAGYFAWDDLGPFWRLGSTALANVLGRNRRPPKTPPVVAEVRMFAANRSIGGPDKAHSPLHRENDHNPPNRPNRLTA